MKNALIRTVVSAAVAATIAIPAAYAAPETDAQKESYAVGASMGNYMAGQLLTQEELGVDFDMDMVIEGMSDALKGEVALDKDTLLDFINARAEKLNERVTLKKSALAKENLTKGREYQAENAKKEGVVTLESGLQYEVLLQGDGDKPNPEDAVTVKYRGLDIDGNIFIDTFEQEPIRVALINVIDGWAEGIQHMTVGSLYRFTIPTEMAYGAQGKDLITPNATLVFEIELVDTAAPGSGHGAGPSNMGGMMGMGMNMGMSAH